MRVNARARTREDRGGDPLDGLVNLFDLGIVLAVAFLLAALSSIDLKPRELEDRQRAATTEQERRPDPADSERSPREIEVKPGQRVEGSGERVGTVYRLKDGRTVLVK